MCYGGGEGATLDTRVLNVKMSSGVESSSSGWLVGDWWSGEQLT